MRLFLRHFAPIGARIFYLIDPTYVLVLSCKSKYHKVSVWHIDLFGQNADNS